MWHALYKTHIKGGPIDVRRFGLKKVFIGLLRTGQGTPTFNLQSMYPLVKMCTRLVRPCKFALNLGFQRGQNRHGISPVHTVAIIERIGWTASKSRDDSMLGTHSTSILHHSAARSPASSNHRYGTSRAVMVVLPYRCSSMCDSITYRALARPTVLAVKSDLSLPQGLRQFHHEMGSILFPSLIRI